MRSLVIKSGQATLEKANLKNFRALIKAANLKSAERRLIKMKKLFQKAVSVLGGFALVGASISGAVASTYPAPFDAGSYAVVYGSSNDMTAANTIANGLPTLGGTVGDFSFTESVSEDEIPLGGNIYTASGQVQEYVVGSTTTGKSKLTSLIDEQMSWDDGLGSENYDVVEKIKLSGMTLKTSLDDNDYEGVAMTNDRALEYQYVFEDALPIAHVGMDNDTGTADTLYLTILGKDYEVVSLGTTSFQVVTSEEFLVGIGQSVTVNGKTFTVGDVFTNQAVVNGEFITQGSTKKIEGMRVKVDTVAYHTNTPESSKVKLVIGEDITKTYSAGDPYLGEDETNPEWVWTYSSPGVANGYIGVKYNYKQDDARDDVMYVGESYVFPENFAAVALDSLTDVSNEDFNVYFDDGMDLWNSTSEATVGQVEDAKVMVIEAKNADKDAILLTSTYGSYETNTLYLRWAENDTGIELDGAYGALEVYFKDVNGDISTVMRPRFAGQINATADGAFTAAKIADLVVGETEVEVKVGAASGGLTLNLTDNGAGNSILVDVGGAALANTTGTLEWLGGNTEATSKGVAETTDVVVGSTNVGTEENDVMTYNGLIVKAPKANAENDDVVISVPNDRVYATVTVGVGAVASGGTTGQKTFMDSESGYSDKNIVVVGGSCVNTVAAELLGGKYCGDAFTGATTVGPGEYLIQTFNYSGKVATLVAGWEKEDTAKAATYLANEGSEISTVAGAKYKGQTATQTVPVRL
jgi:hypothetical protein